MRPLLFISSALAIFLTGNWLLQYRATRLARGRRGTGFENFVAYFSGENVPRDKLRVVYEYLQDWQPVKDFPVQATDDLYKVYGICDDDLDDAVIELAGKWRVVLPYDLTGLGPVNTVADLVLLLSRLPYGRDDTPV